MSHIRYTNARTPDEPGWYSLFPPAKPQHRKSTSNEELDEESTSHGTSMFPCSVFRRATINHAVLSWVACSVTNLSARRFLSFERRICARHRSSLLSSILLALRMRRACIEPFTGIGRPPLGPLGLHCGYSIILLNEMAGRAAPRKVCHALLV
jgi:hypothetical protein